MNPWGKKSKLSKLEVAQILQDFLDGTGQPYAWDDFTLGTSFEDSYLDRIRVRCLGLSEEFPPTEPRHYCGEQGFEVIRAYIRELKS
jgi:hypothetical protein